MSSDAQAASRDHDTEIAYSCSAQGSAHADPDYERVAARYRAPRLSTVSGR